MNDSETELLSMRGQHVLLAGSGGRLGTRLAQVLLDYGADLSTLDHPKGRPSDFPCDLTVLEDIQRTVAIVESTRGHIDVMINVSTVDRATSGFFSPVEDYDAYSWNGVLSVDLDGVFWLSREVGQRMALRGSGAIVNTASIYAADLGVDHRIYAGYDSGPRRMNAPVSYVVAKAGVVGLTRYLSTYWGARGVRVNAVAPGGVEDGQPEDFKIAYAGRVPLGRMARPSEVVGAYLYLASGAASYVTGQVIYVDGGLSAW